MNNDNCEKFIYIFSLFLFYIMPTKHKFSVCKKLSKEKCNENNKCAFTNGKTRKFCRLSPKYKLVSRSKTLGKKTSSVFNPNINVSSYGSFLSSKQLQTLASIENSLLNEYFPKTQTQSHHKRKTSFSRRL